MVSNLTAPDFLEKDADARDALPLCPLAFGAGHDLVRPEEDGHLVLAVTAGQVQIHQPEGETVLSDGALLFVRAGGAPRVFGKRSDDFSCDCVWFSAADEFLSHLLLSEVAVGTVGEGIDLSGIVKMSPYALDYYHDCLKICAGIYCVLAKIARDRMISGLERFDRLADRLAPAVLQIEERYAEPLTVGILAHSCEMSEAAFGQAFKRVYGCTPIRYLIRVRLEAAKDLLANTDRDFEDIAHACGFYSAKYFGDMLKKYEHYSPRALRAMYRSTSQISFF
ncbi:MAG: helix-turn-helix transcriptional regulator [Clostridia bacterium]|nr:helix-turn-helix transcriptional regulator [Clostridia bacterium]